MIAGRYSLEREIGRGGMGTVWLAVDEVLGRPVALKQIGLVAHGESTDLARAEREARLAARLDHPNVVSVFNLAVDPDTGAWWLVMEYVEGTTLADLVQDRGSLSPDEAVPLLRQVADALVAAHAAGIVHRDVKPSNILVDGRGRAKLTDFGIARGATDPSLTQTGLVTGSPAYLPPEVAAGERGDEAVDVWALGATAYYALSGRPPYDLGGNVLGALYRIVHEEPPRLADAGRLGPLLEGTMTKDPARRWSMAQVRDFLADGTRPLAPVPAASPAPVAAAPPGRRRVLAFWLAGLALLLALAVVLGLALGGRPRSSPTAGGSPSAGPSPTRTATKAASPRAPAGPTASGMEAFVRSYVAALSSDPDTAWTMLTP